MMRHGLRIIQKGGDMSDNTKDKADSDSSKAPPVKKKSKLPIIIAIVVALAVGGAASYFFLLRAAVPAKADAKKGKKADAHKGLDDEDADEDQADQPAEEKEVDGKGNKNQSGKPKVNLSSLLPKDGDVKSVIEIQSFVLNLADTDENRFLRLTLSLGMGEESEEKPNPVLLTRVRNAVLAVLMTKTSSDVLSPDGKSALRKELLRAIQAVAKDVDVQAVYITELIVQR
jgi:flagellar FliL protein